jgi:uncharacterized membrane protein (UPF0127 family)
MLVATACGGAGGREATPEGRRPFGTFGETAFRIEHGDGSESRLCCGLLADDRDEQRRGMRERKDFGGYDGMVFAYDEDVAFTYTMSTVPIPLSIAWFDAGGLFVSAQEMAPCAGGEEACPSYAAARAYRFALEMPGPGGLTPLDVGPGSRLVLTDEPCPRV